MPENINPIVPIAPITAPINTTPAPELSPSDSGEFSDNQTEEQGQGQPERRPLPDVGKIANAGLGAVAERAGFTEEPRPESKVEDLSDLFEGPKSTDSDMDTRDLVEFDDEDMHDIIDVTDEDLMGDEPDPWADEAPPTRRHIVRKVRRTNKPYNPMTGLQGMR